MEKLEQIKGILEGMSTDMDKFYNKGQNAAGTRIRKELNNIRKLAAEMRKEIQEMRTERKSS